MKRLILFLICAIFSLFLLTACGHEHEFGEWEIKTDATCTTTGDKVRTCECGHTESGIIPKLGHTVTVVAPVAPTCNQKGSTAGTYCSVCAKYIEKPVILEPAHKYKPTAINSPTCTSKGATLHTCTDCGATYTEELSALGHSYTNATCISPRSCQNCPSIDGKALGHTTAMGVCTRCNVFIYPKVVIPELPIYANNNVVFKQTVLKITDLSYRFSSNMLTFTFSAEKTEETGVMQDENYFCGFSYRLYDSNNNLIIADTYVINDMAVGDKVNDRTITIKLPDNIADSYVLVITDYKQTNP